MSKVFVIKVENNKVIIDADQGETREEIVEELLYFFSRYFTDKGKGEKLERILSAVQLRIKNTNHNDS